MSLIKLQEVVKKYQMGERSFAAVRGMSCEIEEGELVSIMGPSGSGKSTLMHIIGLLDKPTSGKYFLKGADIEHLTSDELAELRNRTIGFVFQQFFLLPRLNALQNVELPLVYQHPQGHDIKERAMEELEKVGMARFAHHKPTELSGGQQQRVAIARALVTKPSIILADEPTGALDTKTSQDVMDLLIKLNSEMKTTVVVITHDALVAKQCRRTIELEDGRIK